MHAQLIHRIRLAPLAALLAALSSGAWAADEPNPYYIGVSETLTRDSNVFRIQDGPADYYSSTALIGGLDQQIGRQRVYANLNVAYNKYKNATILDNTSYGVRAGWDWATINDLTGTLLVDANQGLANFTQGAAAPTTERNLVKTDQASANVRWGGEHALNIVGAYEHSRVDYSAASALSSKATGDSGSIGANYRIGADLRAGGAVRFTRTESPYASPRAGVLVPTGPDDYDPNTARGRNVDLTLDWRSTPTTNLSARLSWTKLTNSNPTQTDFSGLTGGINGSFAPTAKLVFTGAISRDAGTNSAFFNVPSTSTGGTTPGSTTAIPAQQTTLSQGSVTTDIYQLGVVYAATAKINVTANVQRSHAKTVNTSAAAPDTDSIDNGTTSSLGVTWAIARAWQAGCSVAHISRSVSGVGGYSYDANTVSCNAQFTLR